MAASDDPEAPIEGSPPALRGVLYRFAGHALDTRNLQLTVRGQLVRLEPKPLDLLLYLLRHPGEVVTKDELLENVWPDRVLSESVLTKAMAKLRQGLGDEGQEVIRTVHGYGYRLLAPVVAEAAGPVASAPQLDLHAGTAPPLRPLWALRERLGGGGFGEVWLAEHRKTHEQRVFKFALDAQGLAALKREITLSRVLKDTYGQRPDLVSLLDWNLEEAPYFIETEHVGGGSLPAWAARHGGLGKVPLEQRVELVAQTAEALAAAHAAGVLHKDLKPSNILVSEASQDPPRIKLGDFGSGHLTDLARLEQLEITRLGFTRAEVADSSGGSTPRYGAPELASGQLPTVQSDIFALGVVLYQMVTADLQHPLAPGWEAEVDDELLREDIAASAASRPGQRLGDAAELARRLRSLPERRRERARLRAAAAEAQRMQEALAQSRLRRRWAWALSAVLATATAICAILLLQVQRARDAAHASLAEAEALNDFVNEQLLPAADPLAQGGRDADMVRVLQTASRELDRRADLPPAVAARLGDTLGNNFYGLGLLAPARARFEHSLERSLRELGPNHDATNELRMGLAELLREQAEFDTAHGLFVQVAESARRTGSAGWARRSRSGQGWIAYWRGDYAGSARILEPLVAELAAGKLPLPASLAYARWDLSATLIELNRFDQAQRELDAALEYFRREISDSNLLIEWVRGTRVSLHLARGEATEALALTDAILGRMDSQAARTHWAAQTAAYQKGLALLQLGRSAEAERVLDHALGLRKASYGAGHLATWMVGSALAASRLQQGRPDEAALRDLVSRSSAGLGERHPRSLDLQRLFAETLTGAGHPGAARKLIEHVLQSAETALPPAHRLRAELHVALARTLEGKPERHATLAQALSLLQAGAGERHPRTLEIRVALEQDRPPAIALW